MPPIRRRLFDHVSVTSAWRLCLILLYGTAARFRIHADRVPARLTVVNSVRGFLEDRCCETPDHKEPRACPVCHPHPPLTIEDLPELIPACLPPAARLPEITGLLAAGQEVAAIVAEPMTASPS